MAESGSETENRVPAKLPVGPAASPFSLVVRWARHPTKLLDECAARYGDTFTLNFPARPVVVLANPDDVRAVFADDGGTLGIGPANERMGRILGSHSLSVLDGRRHAEERRLLAPPFHGDEVADYGSVILGAADREIATWPVGEPFRS